MNISVNTEQASLRITGSFQEIQESQINITVQFPLPNQSQLSCIIETILNDRFVFKGLPIGKSILR